MDGSAWDPSGIGTLLERTTKYFELLYIENKLTF